MERHRSTMEPGNEVGQREEEAEQGVTKLGSSEQQSALRKSQSRRANCEKSSNFPAFRHDVLASLNSNGLN